MIEFVRGGDLMFHMQRQRRLPEEHARFYSAEICLALNFLHDKGTRPPQYCSSKSLHKAFCKSVHRKATSEGNTRQQTTCANVGVGALYMYGKEIAISGK